MKMTNMPNTPGKPGDDQDLDATCKDLAQMCLRKGNLTGAQMVVKGVYGNRIGTHRPKGKPTVFDRKGGY